MVFQKNCLYNGFSYKLLVCDSFYKNCFYNEFFIQIVGMRWFLCDGFSYELFVCDDFLYILFLLKLFLVRKGVICIFERRVKMCEFCRYVF